MEVATPLPEVPPSYDDDRSTANLTCEQSEARQPAETSHDPALVTECADVESEVGGLSSEEGAKPLEENKVEHTAAQSSDQGEQAHIADRPSEVVIFLAGSTLDDGGGDVEMAVAFSNPGDDAEYPDEEYKKRKLFRERMALELEEIFRKKPDAIDGEDQLAWKCPTCEKEFASLEGLKRHVKRHYKEKSHSCLMCGKKFFRMGDCKRHQRSCQERPYRCEFCVFCFTTKEEWEEHMGRHKSQSGHKCDLCSAKYLHQRSLRGHMRLKHPEVLRKAEEEKAASSMECQHCQESFGDIETFREHMKASHPDLEDKVPFAKYQCKYCPQVFSTLRGQSVHHRTTHADKEGGEEGAVKKKSYQCDLCGKTMSLKNAEYHKRTHTGERPFNCETCGKGFASKPNLKEHLRVHSGDKPFKCRYCPMTFTASGSRVRHERKHTGEMPYSCGFCGKLFRSIGGHEVHERSHTGVTPYQCLFCQQEFTYRNVLNAHMKSVHEHVERSVKKEKAEPPNPVIQGQTFTV